MKKSLLWMLAAILCCGLTTTALTSCGSDDDNPPVSGAYKISATITNNIPCTEGELGQVYAEYNTKLTELVNKINQNDTWDVRTTQSELNNVVAANDAKAKLRFEAIKVELNALKTQFTARTQSISSSYNMLIEVNIKASETLTGKTDFLNYSIKFDYPSVN